MFCTQCDKRNADTANFCYECGTALSKERPTAVGRPTVRRSEREQSSVGSTAEEADNPHRPTPTWKLWLIGILGGLLVAGWMFTTSEDAGATQSSATQLGVWAIRVLAFGAIVAGVGGLSGASPKHRCSKRRERDVHLFGIVSIHRFLFAPVFRSVVGAARRGASREAVGWDAGTRSWSSQ
jgi:zinc ribbon protein